MQKTQLTIHPLALLVPEMPTEDYEALKEDIRIGGQHTPILIIDDRIVDGRHRFRACEELGIEPRYENYVGETSDEAISRMIWSLNVERRHLDGSQRAAIKVDFAEYLAAEGKRRSAEFLSTAPRDQNGHCKPRLDTGCQIRNSRKEAAAQADVSEGLIQNAMRVKREGSPELFEAVKKGEIKAGPAAVLTELPREEQLEIVKNPKRATVVAGNLKRQAKRMKIAQLASASIEHPTGMFAVVYADPPWEYQNVASHGAALDHYPTMALEKLCGLRSAIDAITFPDCALFLWATSPCLPDALKVIEAWGFTYKASAVWNKGPGMGNYFRIGHEFLLLAVKGNLPCPDTDKRPNSIFEASRGKHSEKPEIVYEMIEQMYPGLQGIELFGRKAREGWVVWGKEAPVVESA